MSVFEKFDSYMQHVRDGERIFEAVVALCFFIVLFPFFMLMAAALSPFAAIGYVSNRIRKALRASGRPLD